MYKHIQEIDYSTLSHGIKNQVVDIKEGIKALCEKLRFESISRPPIFIPLGEGMTAANSFIKQMQEDTILPMGDLVKPGVSVHSPIYILTGAGMTPGNSIILDTVCKPDLPLGYGTETAFSAQELIEQILHGKREDEESRRSALLSDFKECTKTKIVLKHELSYGEKCYRVEKIRNVKKYDDLPRKYKTGRNYYYVPYDKPDSVVFWSDEAPYCYTLKEGELISEDLKGWVFRCINKSVKAYKECSRELRRLKLYWDGEEEEFKI